MMKWIILCHISIGLLLLGMTLLHGVARQEYRRQLEEDGVIHLGGTFISILLLWPFCVHISIGPK